MAAKVGSLCSAVHADCALVRFCCSTCARAETHLPNVAYACPNTVGPIFALSAVHALFAFFVASGLGAAVADAAMAIATTNAVVRTSRLLNHTPRSRWMISPTY